jgi:hypothetical protein
MKPTLFSLPSTVGFLMWLLTLPLCSVAQDAPVVVQATLIPAVQ